MNKARITQNEFEALVKYFEPPSGHFLEIGTLKGGTAKLMAERFPSRTIITIDYSTYTEMVEFPNNVIRIIGDSYDVGKQLSGIMTNMFRIIFIDGDHRYNYVKRDASIYEQYLEWKGWLAFHDSAGKGFVGLDGFPHITAHSGVVQVIKELMQTGRWNKVDVVDSLTILRHE